MKKVIIVIFTLIIVLSGCRQQEKPAIGETPLPINTNNMIAEKKEAAVQPEKITRGVELFELLKEATPNYKIFSLNDDEGNLNIQWWFLLNPNDIGFIIYGDRFTITIVEAETDSIFDASSIINDFIENLPEFKRVVDEPVITKNASSWWTNFAVSNIDVTSKTVVSIEQYILVQIVGKTYSICTNVQSLEDEYINKALQTLKVISLPGVAKEDVINSTPKGILSELAGDEFALYDATVISGVNILVAARQYQDQPMAILVKTLLNNIDSVMNYGAKIGTEPGNRFSMKNTQVIGQYPNVEHLYAELSVNAEQYNFDMIPFQNLGGDDYVDITSLFLSYLIRNEKDEIIGIYFEQVSDNV